MKLNILKFKTNDGVKMIFDNYTGIVITETDNTEEILEKLNENKGNISENFDDDNYAKEYKFLKGLYLNKYFNRDEFYKQQVRKKPSLYDGISSHIILITTEDCNLRCKYCVYSDFYEDKKSYSSKKMTFEVAKKAIDMVIEYHNNKVKRGYQDRLKVNFYGGEPLLNFKLVKKIVQYFKKINFNNVDYLITTNGTVMNNEIIDFLAENNFLVAFSIDGNEFNHNRNRVTITGLGTHRKALSSLKQYKKRLDYYGFHDQIINITCCFDNYTNMEDLILFFEDIRKEIPNLNVIYNKIYDVDTGYYDYCDKIYLNSNLDKNTYADSTRKVFNKYYTNQGENIPNSVKSMFTSYYLLKNRKKGYINLLQGNACVIGDKLAVSPDGNIYICEKANQEIRIGDVNKGLDTTKIDDLYDAYYNIREEKCLNCNISRLCDVCYAHFIKNGEIVFNEEFCSKRKEAYTKSLSLLYSKININKHIFDMAE